MTSPDRIPLFIAPKDWIQPIDDVLKVNAIPRDSDVTLEGCLRGAIFQDIPNESTNLCILDTIRLMAKLSDLGIGRSLISVEKSITIQYPLQLEVISCPSWIAPGSTSNISWKVSDNQKYLIIDHKCQ